MGLERRLLTKEELLSFESELNKMFITNKLNVPLHLSGGNEDNLIEIFKQIREEDWIVSYYRNHYHALLKGMPKEMVKNKIIEGKGMSISSKDYKIISSAIVAGQLPIALGIAMAIKRNKSREKVWAFCGDMAAETGVFYECSKYASRQDLPVIFVIEDNGVSIETPTQEVWGLNKVPLKGKIVRYSYNRKYPHHGPEKEVFF